MNCEKCQELIHDFLDGTISRNDEVNLTTHLDDCLDCRSVREDLEAIVGFCRSQRGEYYAPPNEQALWVRIRNVLEVGNEVPIKTQLARRGVFPGVMKRSWELSFGQLAAFAGAIVLLVSLATAVGLRRWDSTTSTVAEAPRQSTSINDRMWQQQQVISYWNQRIELNKARWSPAMRETFDRNMKVIDQAVSESLNELHRNPHDEVSEQMLNDALNDKLSLLKEFSDL